MHSLLSGYSLTDHENGDGLDNRTCNLREANTGSNRMNAAKACGASRFKGVSRNPGTGRPWKASIKEPGRRVHLGYFDDEVEAAMAYDTAAVEAFGNFARTNRMLGLL